MNQTLTNKKKALIVGGGIGGPVAAMALQRAGIGATVYEAYDTPADYAGLFLNTASNGLDVLHPLGIDVPARADGFPIPRMVMWSGTGKRLGRRCEVTEAGGTSRILPDAPGLPPTANRPFCC